MIPIVLRTWTLNPTNGPVLKKLTTTEIAFDERRYTFAAIYDEASLNWYKPLIPQDILVLIGPTGSGKTTTMKLILNDFLQNQSAIIAACEISRNDSFTDLIEGKTKRYVTTIPLEKQLDQKKLSRQVINELSNRRLTASTKANANSSRSCMLVSLRSNNKTLTVIDMMGSEKFEEGDATSNKFANMNNSSITLAILNNATTRRSSNLVTNMIFCGLKPGRKITFVLHVNLAGDRSLIKSSLENIADVVKNLKDTEGASKKRESKGSQIIPLYARPTACSLSPTKATKRKPMVPLVSGHPKKLRLVLSTPSKSSIAVLNTSKARESRSSTHCKPIPNWQQKQRTLVEEKRKIHAPPTNMVSPFVKKALGSRETVVELKHKISSLESDLERANAEILTFRELEIHLREKLEQKGLEADNLQNLLNQALEDLENCRNEMKDAEISFRTKTDLSEKLQATLQGQLETLRQKGNDLSKTLEEESAKNQLLTSQVKGFHSELEKSRSGESQLQAELKKLQDDYQRERMLHDEQTKAQNEDTLRLEQRISDLNTTIQKLQNEYKVSRHEYDLVMVAQRSNEERERENAHQHQCKISELESKLNTEQAKNNALAQQLKKQEEASSQNLTFLQEKVRNLLQDNRQLQEDLTKFKSRGIDWKKRNEVLAREKTLVEASESKLRSKIDQLSASITDLEQYKTRCESLEVEIQDLRSLSLNDRKKLKNALRDMEKHKSLIHDAFINKPQFSPTDIHEDTTYKAYLKQRKGLNEPNSSPLKERNSLEKKHNKRHSLQIPLNAMT